MRNNSPALGDAEGCRGARDERERSTRGDERTGAKAQGPPRRTMRLRDWACRMRWVAAEWTPPQLDARYARVVADYAAAATGTRTTRTGRYATAVLIDERPLTCVCVDFDFAERLRIPPTARLEVRTIGRH